ncbi:MAG: polyprenol monophosphomannose synthase [Myxococcales bacterium]|nr:polyprenol monophosphomannose synthase [Myxococcales bacterium]
MLTPNAGALPKILIITPTYNERENIARLLGAIFEIVPEAHILIVDDNSPDGTGQLADELSAADVRVHVLHRAGKLGLGTAYIAGFKWAIMHDYDLIFEMDADFSHRPEHLPQFLTLAAEYDLVLGCRYIPGGGTRDWGPFRQFISKGGNLYARTILGLPYHDLTGGYKCFRADVLRTIDLDAIQSEGYAFQIELTYRAHRAGFRIAETPIVFPDRTAGKSKMSGPIFMEAVWRVWSLRLGVTPNR